MGRGRDAVRHGLPLAEPRIELYLEALLLVAPLCSPARDTRVMLNAYKCLPGPLARPRLSIGHSRRAPSPLSIEHWALRVARPMLNRWRQIAVRIEHWALPTRARNTQYSIARPIWRAH